MPFLILPWSLVEFEKKTPTRLAIKSTSQDEMYYNEKNLYCVNKFLQILFSRGS